MRLFLDPLLFFAFRFRLFGVLHDLLQVLSMFAGELPDRLSQLVELLLLVGHQVESCVHGGSQLHSAFALGKSLLFRCVSGLLLVFGQQIVQLFLQFRTALTEFFFQNCDFCQ